MRTCTILLTACVIAATACARPAETRQYELQGQILAVEPARGEVLIKHGDIQGFMPAMTMPFKVKDASLLGRQKPGDLVTATLVVGDVDAYLSAISTTGRAELDPPPVVSDTPRILAPGDEVADALLVDQDAKPMPFSSL